MPAQAKRFKEQAREAVAFAERVERFTENAREALRLAEGEAHALAQSQVGQDHLLLGLLRIEDGTAAKVLANLGAGTEDLRAAVLAAAWRGNLPSQGPLPYTSRLKKAVDLAVGEADRFNHYHVGTEHLLLGLIREGEGTAAGVLGTFGVTLEAARAEMLRVLTARLSGSLKRYNLVLPADLFQDVQQIADRQHMTVLEVLRRFVRLGVLVTQLQETPGTSLIIQEGERQREILLL